MERRNHRFGFFEFVFVSGDEIEWHCSAMFLRDIKLWVSVVQAIFERVYKSGFFCYSMGKTIGIIAVKGGVGKTSVATSLAEDLVASYGKKVLLVDANYSGPTAGIHFNLLDSHKTVHDVLAGKVRLTSAIQQKYGVDVLAGSTTLDPSVAVLKLKDKLQVVKGAYDFIILDGSPCLNEEILSTILASDVLFVVSTPDA